MQRFEFGNASFRWRKTHTVSEHSTLHRVIYDTCWKRCVFFVHPVSTTFPVQLICSWASALGRASARRPSPRCPRSAPRPRRSRGTPLISAKMLFPENLPWITAMNVFSHSQILGCKQNTERFLNFQASSCNYRPEILRFFQQLIWNNETKGTLPKFCGSRKLMRRSTYWLEMSPRYIWLMPNLCLSADDATFIGLYVFHQHNTCHCSNILKTANNNEVTNSCFIQIHQSECPNLLS